MIIERVYNHLLIPPPVIQPKILEKFFLVTQKSYSMIPPATWGCPRGVMVKSDGLRNRSPRVRTPVALLRSLSGKIPLGKV